MITTAHVAVSPLTGERHTLIRVSTVPVFVQACRSGFYFLTCACEDDEGCMSP